MDVNKMFYTGYRCPKCKDTGWIIEKSEKYQDFALPCICRQNGTFFQKKETENNNNNR